jgi:hypothetical protein
LQQFQKQPAAAEFQPRPATSRPATFQVSAMFTLLMATRPPPPLSRPCTHLIASPRCLIYSHSAHRATALWSPGLGPRPRQLPRQPPAGPSCKNWTTPVRAPSHQGTARPAQRALCGRPLTPFPPLSFSHALLLPHTPHTPCSVLGDAPSRVVRYVAMGPQGPVASARGFDLSGRWRRGCACLP